MHKKQYHIANIATCWNFACGNCEFGDETCWFKHDIEGDPKPEEYKCKQCGKDFVTKSTLLKHNKMIIVRVLKNVEIKEIENAYIKVRIVGLSMKKQNSWMK